MLAGTAFSLARPDTVMTGETAALFSGLPVSGLTGSGTAAELTVRARRPSHRGPAPATTLPVPSASSLSSRFALPHVRQLWDSPVYPGSATRRVTAKLNDGTVLPAVQCDGLGSIQLFLASRSSLRHSIPGLDALARLAPDAAQRWATVDVATLGAATEGNSSPDSTVRISAAAARRHAAAWAFADARSESAGESLSRVLIHELGFVPPDLQVTVFDDDGTPLGRPDFLWKDVQVGGEFDGIGKYTMDFYATEHERRSAIAREKNREVALRRRLRGLARWTWEDLKDPRRLAAELDRHGVPRR